MKEKTPFAHKVVCFQMLEFDTSNSKSQIEENYFFLKNYVTSEGAVSQNIFYYQQLPITHTK